MSYDTSPRHVMSFHFHSSSLTHKILLYNNVSVLNIKAAVAVVDYRRLYIGELEFVTYVVLLHQQHVVTLVCGLVQLVMLKLLMQHESLD
jgi:hypothetical protein